MTKKACRYTCTIVIPSTYYFSRLAVNKSPIASQTFDFRPTMNWQFLSTNNFKLSNKAAH